MTPFCDWISLAQQHDFDLPVVGGGWVREFTADGELSREGLRRMEFEGSHDSRVHIRCDGKRVELCGNISRFGKPENVFGLSVKETVEKANRMLAHLGLPPFTAGQPMFRQVKTGHSPLEWTGAVIREMHLTANYSTGGSREAAYLLQAFRNRVYGRVKTKIRDTGSSVTWNEGSQYWYNILYLKYRELIDHGFPVDSDIVEWCEQNGIVRFEAKLKQRYLTQNGLRFLGAWQMSDYKAAEETFKYHFDRCVTDSGVSAELPLADSIPDPFQGTYCKWLNGLSFDNMHIRKFQRHRKFLIEKYGVDIGEPFKSVEASILQFPVKIHVVEMKPISAPDWYDIRGNSFAA